MLRVIFSLTLVFASVKAQAGTVGFCAPAGWRAGLAAELAAQGREPLDLSEIDEALFGPNGAEASINAGVAFRLDAALPRELREDFTKGLLGCRARGSRGRDAKRACTQHLVNAVWERHLARLKPELVIEIKPMTMIDAASVVAATYKPGDAVIARALCASPKEVNEIVSAALNGDVVETGGRSNIAELPEKTPPPPAQLRQGAPQSLEALEVPEGCSLPPKLMIDPPHLPLAITIGALWEATAAGHLKAKARSLQCSLELHGPKTNPHALVLHCGSELATEELFVGTPFGDAKLQAALARRFVTLRMHAYCANESESKRVK